MKSFSKFITGRETLPAVFRKAATFAALAVSLPVFAQIPSFPGAEGFGAYAWGGRGGDVYHVSNLNSSGAGSFAEALATVPPAGRTIVFDVSGYIRFPSGSDGTRLLASKVTIAGQTAPGDGIGFYNNVLRISGDDIIIRHVRFRRGKTESSGDCVNLDSGCLNAMLDHLSIQFSTDENISSFSSPPENVTLQHSLNSWGLQSHSCGGLWDQNHATSHHNLWSHNHTRNPKARPDGLLEWINNITFDWDIGFIMGDSRSEADWKANVIGNYFICPPGNTQSRALVKATVADSGRPNFRVYLSGNLSDYDGDTVLNGTDKGYAIVEGTPFSDGQTGVPGMRAYYRETAPMAGSAAGVTADSPLLAYKKIISNAGALRLDSAYAGSIRDEVDTILIGNLTSLSRGHVSHPRETGAANDGMGFLNSALPLPDTDRDGMPDQYENAVGMNPSADDHNTEFAAAAVSSGSTFFPAGSPAGYTYLEEYLHFKASPHTYVAKNTEFNPTYADIDLARYAAGFSEPPVIFTVTAISGGTVTELDGTGRVLGNGHLVRFTPESGYSGRAGFDFTVTDGSGESWKQRFLLIVTLAGIPKNLRWQGDDASNVWDTSIRNWRLGDMAAAFDSGDTVTFDDSGSASPPILINTALSPGAVTVNAERNYTLSGTGGITSDGMLLKSGSGILSVNVPSTFTAGINFEGGAIFLNRPGNLGSAPIAVSGNVGISSGYSSSYTLALHNNISVHEKATLALNLSQRTEINGSLTGFGTVNLYAPSTLGTEGRDYWDAASAMFSGNLNISGGGSGRLALRENGGGFDGFDKTYLTLSDITLFNANYSSGGVYRIGSLSGNRGAVIRGCYNAGGSATTLIIGGLNRDSDYAGSIHDGSVSETRITKEGAGTLTLSGTCEHTGATSVNGGTLLLNGRLGNSALTVAGEGCLAGGGSTGGSVTLQSGASLTVGSNCVSRGALNIAGGFSATSATLAFDLSSSPSGSNDRIAVNGGSGYLAGANTFLINFAEEVLGAGNYRLIQCAPGVPLSVQSGMTMHLLTGAPAGSRQTYTISRTASGTPGGYVQLAVSGNPAVLVWKGADGGTWDHAALNWLNGTNSDRFYNFDAVTFGDIGGGTVLLSGALQPRVVTVDNTTAPYTFNGADGTINGSGSLVKSGTGTLTIAATNAFTGGTTINGGTVVLASDAANIHGLGSGRVTFNGGSITMHTDAGSYNSQTYLLTVPEGQTGTLNADARCNIYGALDGGGTFNVRVPWVRTGLNANWSAFSGRINLTTDSDGGDLRMASDYAYPGFPNAAVHMADKVRLYYVGIIGQGAGTSIPIGELSGESNAVLMGGPTFGRSLTYRIGGRNTDAVFNGYILEQYPESTITSITKTGAGIWTFNGTGTWNGGTAVEEGMLRISGSISCAGAVEVQEGACLALEGGSLASDAVNIAGNASFTGNGEIDGDLNNDGTLTCTGGFLRVTGNIVNNGTMRFTGGGGIIQGGNGSTFINTGLLDLITGFQSLPENFENSGTVLDSSDVIVTTAGVTGNAFAITIKGFTGHNYQLQQRGSLFSGTWQNIGDPQAGDNGENLFFSVPLDSSPHNFFRIWVAP